MSMLAFPAVSHKLLNPSALRSKRAPKVPVAILPFPKSTVSNHDRTIASGIPSRSRYTTRRVSSHGYNRTSAEDTLDEGFGEDQARSINANNATYGIPARPSLYLCY